MIHMKNAVMAYIRADLLRAMIIFLAEGLVLLFIAYVLWNAHYGKAWRSKTATNARRAAAYWLKHRKLPRLKAEFDDRQEFKDFRPGWDACRDIGAAQVSAAVAAAEFDAWCAYMCRQEYEALKKAPRKEGRLARRIALDAYKAALYEMEPYAEIKKIRYRRHGKPKKEIVELQLPELHAWLDDLLIAESGKKPDPSPAERFEAFQAARFTCPQCRRDPSDGIRLTASRQADGTLKICCTDCLFELDEDLMDEIRRSVETVKENREDAKETDT